MSTNIKEYSFAYGGLNYFRGNAHLVQLGTFGEKKDPIGAKAYLEPQAKIKAEHLSGYIRKGKPIAVNFSQVTQAALESNGKINVFGIGATRARSFTFERAKQAKLVLLNFSLTESALKRVLNNGADGARGFLANEGKDGRVVSEVWVVMEAELGEQFKAAGSDSLSVSVEGADLNVTIKGSSERAQTITLSAGDTFAYKLHKVKEWDKNKTTVKNLEADYKGLN